MLPLKDDSPYTLVDNDADSVLCDVVDTSSPAVVRLVGHALLNGSITLKKKTHTTRSRLVQGHKISMIFLFYFIPIFSCFFLYLNPRGHTQGMFDVSSELWKGNFFLYSCLCWDGPGPVLTDADLELKLKLTYKISDFPHSLGIPVKIFYLYVHDVSSLVHFKVGGQGHHTLGAESPREHIARTAPITLGVRHGDWKNTNDKWIKKNSQWSYQSS